MASVLPSEVLMEIPNLWPTEIKLATFSECLPKAQQGNHLPREQRSRQRKQASQRAWTPQFLIARLQQKRTWPGQMNKKAFVQKGLLELLLVLVKSNAENKVSPRITWFCAMSEEPGTWNAAQPRERRCSMPCAADALSCNASCGERESLQDSFSVVTASEKTPQTYSRNVR